MTKKQSFRISYIVEKAGKSTYRDEVIKDAINEEQARLFLRTKYKKLCDGITILHMEVVK